jgi:endogenous inhibitor of DNA gyrase (YacG/DUF329 family)
VLGMRFRPNDLPEGASDFQETADAFTMKLSIDADEEGYFGRECPDCGAYFKLKVDEYEELPDDLTLTCPYCGHSSDHSNFITADQKEKAVSVVREVAMPAVTDEVNRMLKLLETQADPRSLIDLSVRVNPGRYTPQALHTYIETETRRDLKCASCSRHAAAYKISMYCPFCGLRPPLQAFEEGLGAMRAALDAFSKVPPQIALMLEAQGGAEALTVSALVDVVSGFETYTRERFRLALRRKIGADEADRVVNSLRPNAFQNLGNAASLYEEHLGVDLRSLMSREDWSEISLGFERRHLFQHRRGVVDKRYVEKSGDHEARLGQRLSIGREQAEQVMSLLEKLAEAIERSTADTS